MSNDRPETEPQQSWLDRGLGSAVGLDAGTLIFAALLALALLTRFYDLETRVMSHDESLHTQFSLYLTQGNFEHTPLMHGPLQFHLVGLSYFLFGASDAAARIPAALFGVIAVGLVYVFRRWIGKTGALIGMGMMLISPFILYYSRYVRNESFVVVSTLLTLIAVFFYFETRKVRWLYMLSFALMLHFTAKETAFIQVAQMMIFLGGFLAWELLRERWENTRHRWTFLLGLLAMVTGAVVGVGGYLLPGQAALQSAQETAQPLLPTGAEELASQGLSSWVGLGLLLVLVGIALVAAALLLAHGAKLRTKYPALDILLVMGTMTLPQLGSIPASLLGWDPLNYQDPDIRLRTGIVVLVLIALSILIGAVWNWRRWIAIAGIFYGPYLVLYTTVFTNPNGVATGLVGSLGYWLVQHGVERGSQPWYYYMLVQTPVYEFLPALGTLLALWYWTTRPVGAPGSPAAGDPNPQAESGRWPGHESDKEGPSFPVVPLLGYLALTSLAAYSFAGERMPWLMVHITLPMILLSGWSFATLVRDISWRQLWGSRSLVAVPILLLALICMGRALGYALGETPPFQGSELIQLRATTGFLVAFIVAAASVSVLLTLAWKDSLHGLPKIAQVIFIGLLGLLTARTAFRAAYVNYDNATEFLVYAHSATGVKTVMRQVEDFSRRTTDGLAVEVAYGDDVAWPLTWYLRDYSNAFYYGANPSRELLDRPLVIAGDSNWDKVDPILGDRYIMFEYIRMWWPMQDYFDLSWDRVLQALRSPDYRAALWDIWLDRDFSAYGNVTGRDFSLERWQPSDRMRLYVRKDVAAMVWDYGMAPTAPDMPPYVDPYAQGILPLAADRILTVSEAGEALFSRPRDVAVAPDGSIYVADTANDRIQHLTVDGEVLATWSTFSISDEAGAPAETFNEPWGIGIAFDGSVYVADTWNHRILHFSASGVYLDKYGYYASGDDLLGLWGPRDVAIDESGRVFISDTGNKRIVVVGPDGRPVTQFGGPGLGPGALNEPVGLALDSGGRLYVADTWNQRIQVFSEVEEGRFEPSNEWFFDGWFGQGVENKPYLAIGPSGDVCASDPEGFRVICFTDGGDYLLGWGDYGAGAGQFDIPNGLAFDSQGNIWLVDSGGNRLMRFQVDLR